MNGSIMIKRAQESTKPKSGRVPKFPYLIIEENDLRIASAAKVLGDIPYLGGLHQSRKQYLKEVHAIEPSYEQVYMARRLSYNPHWGAMPHEMEDVKTDAEKLGAQFSVHRANRDHISDVLTILNNSSTGFEKVKPYYEKIG